MTANDLDSNQDPDAGAGADRPPNEPSAANRSLGRRLRSSIGRHGRAAKVLALLATIAVVGGAYVVGGPPDNSDHTLASLPQDQLAPRAAATAAPAIPAAGAPALGTSSGSGVDQTLAGAQGATDQSQNGGQSQLFATIDASQIVKTGQMTLEIADIDAALAQAQTAIAGLGGYVDATARSGTGADATATVTFRLPAAQWDNGLAAMRKLATKDVFEQTSTTDVTSQVIDLNARIDNLKTTEAALQAIMTRTGSVADILAVETQLSDTQGQIEELTAERDNLANQASMSTLAVTFQLPTSTVTTQATQDWTLGSQVDQAVATLVRVGQGLATMAVWLVIVVLPVGVGLLVLVAIFMVARRLGRRGGRSAVAGA